MEMRLACPLRKRCNGEEQECGMPIGYQKGLGGYQKELEIVKTIRRRYRIKVSMILRLLREHLGTVLLLNPNHARYF